MSESQYSVPLEAKKLLVEGLINNRLQASSPPEIQDAGEDIEYSGSNLPVIAVNWRFAESISAIKGYQGAMLNVLLKRKYGISYQKIVINTDHAQLFIMSAIFSVLDPHNQNIRVLGEGYDKYFPTCDKHGDHAAPLRVACTNIYKTKDDRFYHMHGSLNPRPTQDALGIQHDVEVSSTSEACDLYQSIVKNLNSKSLDSLINDQHRQAGTICWSTEEYLSSPHGKSNAHVGIYEVHYIPNIKQSPGWWTSKEETNPSRPLAGLKVLDLTRIIAGPTVSRELAELGASVLRITSPHISDGAAMHADLNWGKWNASLDLRNEKDRDTLKNLVKESDVVLDGYRPGVMEKWGFGKDDILKLFENEQRGVIYAHVNCYGWNGPWAHRSGWQQISDANCGVSLEYGRAMGQDEAVGLPFLNSDYSTGACGATGVLQAIIERAEKGGSYVVDIALNYYSQWLINSCSTYPSAIWDAIWTKNGRPVFHHQDHGYVLFPAYMEMLQKNGPAVLNPEFFEDRESKVLGIDIRTVKPVLRFPEGIVKPGYNVGTRGNGVDAARWPEDLLTEQIQS